MENMQWQSAERKVGKTEIKREKKNLSIHSMDQVERGKDSVSRHAGREARHRRAGEG